MPIKKIKISELPLADKISGLYTLGVDALNRSVKVSMEFLSSAAKKANDAATEANKAADLANKTIAGYIDRYPYDLEVLSRQDEKSNLYCRVRGIAENEDISSLRIFLMRTLKRHKTGHYGNDGQYYFKDVLGWRHPVHNQTINPQDLWGKIFPDSVQNTEFPVQRGEFLVGNILEICVKPFARYNINSGTQEWYVRLGKNYVDSGMKGYPVLTGINRDYGLAVYKIVDGAPVRVSKIVPFDISVCITLYSSPDDLTLESVGGNLYVR